MNPISKISWPFVIKLCGILVSIIALVYIAHIGQTIIVPFIMGSLFALLLAAVCNWIEQHLRLPRSITAILVTTLFFGIIAFIFLQLGAQLSLLKNEWPAFEQQIKYLFSSAQEYIDHQFGINSAKQIEYLNETAAKSVNSGTVALGIVLLSFSSIFILCLFTFLYTFFLLIYRRHILRFFLLLNAETHHHIVLDIMSQVRYMVKKYLTGLVIQMIIVAAMIYIALLCIGVKYALLLAVISGVFNVLPYVGILTSMLIVSLMAFATGIPTDALWVIFSYVVIHAIDGNFIVPKIVGSKVKVNSLFAMMAIIIGEMTWGISGMFLAIPILAIVKIVFDRISELKAWGFLLGEEDDLETSYAHVVKRVFQKKNVQVKK